MNRQNEGEETPSLSKAMEKYSHIEGDTPREKLRNAYAQLRGKQHTPSSIQRSGVSMTPSPAISPSPAKDIDYPIPQPESDRTIPLSVRIDKDSVAHIHHSSPSEKHPLAVEPLLQPDQMENPEPSAVATIQPSALAVDPIEESPPGSVRLGPSEFAIPLPMDSRVKDDYEKVLMEHFHDIQAFLDPNPQMRESEVS